MESKLVGNKIAEARKKRNISQAQLAEQLFISSQAVGKWERGESLPDIITLNRLAEILGVDLNYFSEKFNSAGNAKGADELKEHHAVDPELEKPNQPEEKGARKLSWDMSRGNWVDADFSGLKNLHEKFNASNMQRCKFIGSDMSGLLLKANNVMNCDFSGSDFSRSHIEKSNLTGNRYNECTLNDTKFSESFISGCDFTKSDFTGVVFQQGGVEKNVMLDAVLKHTSFISTYLAHLTFNGTLDDCYFENCSFKKVTFEHANLLNSFFKNKNLKGIRFVDCYADRMTYEFLKNGKADLTGIALLPE